MEHAENSARSQVPAVQELLDKVNRDGGNIS